MRRLAGWIALLAPLVLLTPTLWGQAAYTATGPGDYITMGLAGSGFESDYGKHVLTGPTLYVDGNLFRRVGVEAEVRGLRFHSDTGQQQTTYLVGPKISTHGRGLRPYAKLLAGRGHYVFPYRYAEGSYFVAAPGAGLDWRVSGSPWMVRLIDFEYQLWPGFTFGELHPYGISAGIAFELFHASHRLGRRLR